MKITDYDLKMMKNDITNIIIDSRMSAILYNISDVQPNFNTLLKDFNGPIHYMKQLDIPVELVSTDDSIKYLTKLEKTHAGDKYNGIVMLNIPFSYYKIINSVNVEIVSNVKEDSIVFYNNEIFRVLSIHPKEFENAVILYKIIGRDPLSDIIID